MKSPVIDEDSSRIQKTGPFVTMRKYAPSTTAARSLRVDRGTRAQSDWTSAKVEAVTWMQPSRLDWIPDAASMCHR